MVATNGRRFGKKKKGIIVHSKAIPKRVKDRLDLEVETPRERTLDEG